MVINRDKGIAKSVWIIIGVKIQNKIIENACFLNSNNLNLKYFPGIVKYHQVYFLFKEIREQEIVVVLVRTFLI